MKVCSMFGNCSKKIKSGNEGRNLYRTKDGYLFWLDEKKYLDKCVIETGVFEKESTLLVKKLITLGNCVLDIGANIGYYSVIFSKLTGSEGRVLSFEPVKYYREILLKNLMENNIENCKVFGVGISDKKQEVEISKGDCSATLHWVNDVPPGGKEMINLVRLDDFIQEIDAAKIDVIKLDVDGHEPACLDGAWESIVKFKPIILLEMSHEHYLDYGITAWDFYDLLKSKGLQVFSEKTYLEYSSKREFLIECGNFAYSANIILAYPEKSGKIKALT